MKLVAVLCLASSLLAASLRTPTTFLASERGSQPFDVLAHGDNSCYTKEDKGKSYRGLATSTASGRACQRWTEDHPHTGTSKYTIGQEGLGNHNYCRNPDGSMEKPWCFTMDTNPEHEKEECQIP